MTYFKQNSSILVSAASKVEMQVLFGTLNVFLLQNGLIAFAEDELKEILGIGFDEVDQLLVQLQPLDNGVEVELSLDEAETLVRSLRYLMNWIEFHEHFGTYTGISYDDALPVITKMVGQLDLTA